MEMKGIPVVVPAAGGRKMMVLGNEITVKLDSAQTGGALFVFENTVGPGEGVPPHVHSQEDEMIHMIEGTCEVFLDGKVFTAAAGSVINFPRNVVHGFRNTSGAPARALFIATPGENFEAFFNELSAVAPTRPADMEKVASIFARYGLPIAAPVGAA
jgi:quercetin dioxygenase-like cupin family protein